MAFKGLLKRKLRDFDASDNSPVDEKEKQKEAKKETPEDDLQPSPDNSLVHYSQDAGNLCVRCAAFDFDDIFSSFFPTGPYDQSATQTWKRTWHSVADLGIITKEQKTSRCSFCRLITAVAPANSAQELTLCKFGNWTVLGKDCRPMLGVLRSEDAKLISKEPEQSLRLTGYLIPHESKTSMPHPQVRLLSDQIELSLVLEWLQDCCRGHGDHRNCQVAERSMGEQVHITVVDCRTKSIVHATKPVRYAALSYVWGPPTLWVDDQTLFLPAQLPKTIEDAIAVTLALHIQYLWIDRYCISKDAQLKHEQVQKMDEVYSQAEITIIAAVGVNPSYGLPGVNGTPRHKQPSAKVRNYHLVSTLCDPATCITNSKWSSRAWTYQEVLLSRRRLYFTDQQVYFECSGKHHCETIDWRRPREYYLAEKGVWSRWGIYSGRNEFLTPEEQLANEIREYSLRALTYPSDYLKAFLGILRTYERLRIPIHHYCGVPLLPNRDSIQRVACKREASKHFTAGLGWQMGPAARRPGFPSWSWTGWIGAVELEPYSTAIDIPRTCRIDDIDVKVYLEHHDNILISFDTFESNGGLSHSIEESTSPILHLDAWTVSLSLVPTSSFVGTPGQLSYVLAKATTKDGITISASALIQRVDLLDRDLECMGVCVRGFGSWEEPYHWAPLLLIVKMFGNHFRTHWNCLYW